MKSANCRLPDWLALLLLRAQVCWLGAVQLIACLAEPLALSEQSQQDHETIRSSCTHVSVCVCGSVCAYWALGAVV